MHSSESNTEPIAIRRMAYYSGTVQGVGFRYTTCRIARDYHVTGYVKNLLDGRVEIIAEGLPDEIERFAEAVEQALQPYIEYSTATDSTATGEFTSFDIAY